MAELVHEITEGRFFEAIVRWKDTKYRITSMLVIAQNEEEARNKVEAWVLEQHPSLQSTEQFQTIISSELILK